MSISEKKAAANRRNARKSTGPKTQRGKMFSRINAVKHGMFSQHSLLMKDENPTDFTAHRTAYRNHYRPTTQAEHFLVDRMILAAWRLTRLAALEPRMVDTQHRITKNSHEARRLLMLGYRYVLGKKGFAAGWRRSELDVFERHIHGCIDPTDDTGANPASDSDPALLDPVAHALIRDSEGGNTVTKMARYQTALERSFYRAAHELERLRAASGTQTAAGIKNGSNKKRA